VGHGYPDEDEDELSKLDTNTVIGVSEKTDWAIGPFLAQSGRSCTIASMTNSADKQGARKFVIKLGYGALRHS
jgi:hypothetical protein